MVSATAFQSIHTTPVDTARAHRVGCRRFRMALVDEYSGCLRVPDRGRNILRFPRRLDPGNTAIRNRRCDIYPFVGHRNSDAADYPA